LAKDYKGKHVYGSPDWDQDGYDYISKVMTSAVEAGAMLVKVVEIEGKTRGDDLKDWLQRDDNSISQWVWLAQHASAWTPKWNPSVWKATLRLTFIDMSRWDFEPTPEQEWAVFNRIPLRQTVLFSGEGATGKSIGQLHLSVATVLNRDWLGITPGQGPAIFIDAEDDDKVLHRRLKAIAEHYQTSITEMIRCGLRLVSWVGCDATLAFPSKKSGKIEPTPLYHQLLEETGDIKPRLVGIASSANVFAGNEIDRGQVQQFVGLLTRIAMVANGSVVLISHPSLSGISSESGLSGSTQWHNAVRARYFLRGVKPEAGEPLDTDMREIVFKKNNYGPISENIILRWDNGLFLPVTCGVDQAAKDAIACEVFIGLLKRFHAANRNVSDKPSVSYAPSVFAKEEEAKRAGLNSQDLTRAMQELFRLGKIWNEPYGRPSRPSYRIAEKVVH
jgi:hypothetical protein